LALGFSALMLINATFFHGAPFLRARGRLDRGQQLQRQKQMRGFFAALRMTQLLRWVDGEKKGRAVWLARPALQNDGTLGGLGVEDYFGPAFVAVVEVFVGGGGFG
jgi:hypothetical protein